MKEFEKLIAWVSAEVARNLSQKNVFDFAKDRFVRFLSRYIPRSCKKSHAKFV
jgi:predicted site-specific integrase-resolvase